MGIDLQEIPRQDSGRSTHALGHGTAQSQISFLPQVDRQQLKLYVPTCLEGSAGTTSFYRPVPTREQVWLREAAFKVGKIGERALASRSEPSSSDDEGGSSDIDPEPSSELNLFAST